MKTEIQEKMSGENIKEEIIYIINKKVTNYYPDYRRQSMYPSSKYNPEMIIPEVHDGAADEIISKLEKDNDLEKIIFNKFKEAKKENIYISIEEIANILKKYKKCGSRHRINKNYDWQIKNYYAENPDINKRKVNFYAFKNRLKKEYQSNNHSYTQTRIELDKMINELENIEIIPEINERDNNIPRKNQIVKNKTNKNSEKIKSIYEIEDIKTMIINYYKKNNIDFSNIKNETIIDIINNKTKTFYINGKFIVISKETINEIIKEHQESIVDSYINSIENPAANEETKIKIKK